MKEGWKKFSQQMKEGFDKFGKDTKKFFNDIGDKIKKESDKAIENIQHQHKINLVSICQRQNSNVPLFALDASQSIIKHLGTAGMFKHVPLKSQHEFDKLWKGLKKTGCVEKVAFIDPVILGALFIKFYKALDHQLFDEIAPSFKNIGNDVEKAAETLKALNLHYQYNTIFILRFLKIVSEKEKSFELKTLVDMFSPSFSQKIDIKDEGACSTFEFLINQSDKIEKALGIDCSQFIQPLEAE